MNYSRVKRPLMGLVVGGEESVKSGSKEVVIREGVLAYEVGDRVMLGCPNLNWAAYAEVVDTYVAPLSGVSIVDIRDAGWASHEAALEGLQARSNPHLTRGGLVTVIRWNLLSPRQGAAER